jgi:hypothetical protein
VTIFGLGWRRRMGSRMFRLGPAPCGAGADDGGEVCETGREQCELKRLRGLIDK